MKLVISLVARSAMCAALVSSVLGVAAGPTARADTLYSNLGPAPGYQTGGGNYFTFGSGTKFGSETYAFSFSPSASGSVTQLDLAASFYNDPSNLATNPTANISFYTNNAGMLGSQVGGSFTFIAPNNPALVAVIGITGVNLVTGQSYFLAFTPSTANSSVSEYVTSGSTSSAILFNNGSGWASAGSGRPVAFDILGPAAGVPDGSSSLVLLGLGFLSVLSVRHCDRVLARIVRCRLR